MPINNPDVADLPDAGPQSGHPPVKQPLVIHHLARLWHEHYLAAGEDERAFAVPGTRFRASWAGGCARNLGYRIAEHDAREALNEAVAEDRDRGACNELAAIAEALAPSNPPSVSDAWRMGLGTLVHNALEETIASLTDIFPGATFEVAVDMRPDLDGSGTVDIVIRMDAHAALKAGLLTDEQFEGISIGTEFVIVIELKTINGFGYKMSATTFKGPAEGPRHSAVLQGALTAVALKADLLIVGYLSLECISPDVAARNGLDDIGRFAAEWHFTPEQFTSLAEREHLRVKRVLEFVDAGELAPRAIADPEIPAKARITDPSTGAWQVVDPTSNQIISAGKTWYCGYCWNRDRCIKDGPS